MERTRNNRLAAICAAVGIAIMAAGCFTGNDICMTAGIVLLVCSTYIR